MTEAEWLNCADPEAMVEFIRDKVTDRKVRLFGVACCRRVWDALPYETERIGVATAERYADGEATIEELVSVNDAIDAKGDTRHSAADYLSAVERRVVCQVAGAAAWSVAYNAPRDTDGEPMPSWEHWEDGELREQTVLLRDIFANPFRPVAVILSWLTPDVIALAASIYAERAFDRLPILADALEEAGCDHTDILTHCRGDGPHVRGCWVVDLLLGKE